MIPDKLKIANNGLLLFDAELTANNVYTANSEELAKEIAKRWNAYNPEQLEEMKSLAHQGLPDDCIQEWDNVKFCPNRNGDGNMCKHCSDFK